MRGADRAAEAVGGGTRGEARTDRPVARMHIGSQEAFAVLVPRGRQRRIAFGRRLRGLGKPGGRQQGDGGGGSKKRATAHGDVL